MMLSTSITSESFFLKRIIRIVPSYWFLTLVVFGVALLKPSLLNSTTPDIGHLLQSLLFIPFEKNGSGHYPILFLGWTLNYEMYYYLLFALAMFLSTTCHTLLTTILLLAVFLVAKRADTFPLLVYGNLLVFEFALGMTLYLVLERLDWRQAFAVCALVVVAAFLSGENLSHRFFIFGLPVLVFTGFVLKVFRNTRFPKFFLPLGGASYALYLTHPYVIQIFDKVTGWSSAGPILTGLAFVISVGTANIFAILFYRMFELPVRKFLRSQFVPSKDKGTQAPVH